MSYTNSELITKKIISPNSTNPRRNKIKKIVIHHTGVVITARQCANGFANPSREAAANYVIDDKDIVLCVDERNRAWTTGNTVDHEAVTMEVANDGDEKTDWHVSDKALENTINLCVDICIRNGIEALNFTGNKNGNLMAHKWYQPTICPGPYLYSKFPYIAEEVNKRLDAMKEMENLDNKIVISGNRYMYDGLDYTFVFNPNFYAERYKDIKDAFGYESKQLFYHFIYFGMKECRQAIDSFEVHCYKNRYPDLQKAFGNNWPEYYKHYIQYGYNEKRIAI